MALTSPKMGLRIWDQLGDPYDHNQMADNWSKVDFHDHTPGRGVQIPTEGIADGAVTSSKLSSAIFSQGSIFANSLDDAARLGLTDGATVRRGKSIIATSESRTGTTYGLLTTPDRVPNVVVPTNGLLAVLYQADMLVGAAGQTGRAAIFIGSTQVSIEDSIRTQAASTLSTTPGATWGSLRSFAGGLAYQETASGGTTGMQIVGTRPQVLTGMEYQGSVVEATTTLGGGVCWIAPPAGTYDVTIQFKATTSNIQARNRALYVWTTGW